MALEIANPAIEQDLLRLARERGETIDQFLRTVVMSYKRHGLVRPSKPTAAEIMALVRSFPGGPADYDLSEEEILGYGSSGLSE
jgi:hypothetical protein